MSKNNNILKAVQYVKSLKNMPTQKAIVKAAKYYKVDVSDVVENYKQI